MKNFLLYLMAALYVAAGVNHFWHPKTYLRIMPSWLPWHSGLVAASGVAEIVLGLLLLPAITRPFAAWGIILLLIAVFPANVHMAVDWYRKGNPSLWLALLRLPLQILLIAWAYRYARSI